ncbi:MAG: transcriptional repressor LexA [Phycisphaerae bacterium]|nr:transcriptional repressor LexA [Phycisphaerae bacterium]
MVLKLTPKQMKILTLVRDSLLTRGYSPTYQEMADELGTSKVTVFEHVNALIRKGALQRDPNKARSLEPSPEAILPDEDRHTRLPLVGSIAAGVPIEAVEERQYLDLEDLFAPPGASRTGDTFALQVTGNSMIGEQICDGDYVVCRRTETARNGETVVALLADGEATLKKFYKERDRIRLEPANPEFEPIIVTGCQIQGVVIGVLRTY